MIEAGLVLAGLSAAAALLGWHSVRRLVKARTIEDTPRSRVRSAAQGHVMLQGWARDGAEAPLLAPLSGTPCLWYEYRIERYQGSGRSRGWRRVESGRSQRLFSLDDDTGHCHIDPEQAHISTSRRRRWYGGQRHPQRPATSRIGLRSAGRYRYTEDSISAGQWLYALGWFETLHAPCAQTRTQQRMQQLLNEWKQDRERLLARFDRDGDGDISLEEWEQARAEAAREAHYHIVREPDDTSIHWLGRAPQRRLPYVISTRDPEWLARRYRRQSLFWGLLTVALASASLWLLLHLS